jgi:hypothetical protein
MEPLQNAAKTGFMHNIEQVPAWVVLVNEKLQVAIKKAAHKYMMTKEEMRGIVYSDSEKI